MHIIRVTGTSRWSAGAAFVVALAASAGSATASDTWTRVFDARERSSGSGSPSGTIVYERWHAKRNAIPALFTVAAAGGSPRPLRDRYFHGLQPAFSPDGRWVAFARWRDTTDERFDGGYRLVVARSDGTQARVIVRNQEDWEWHQWPSWSRDGRLIAYRSSGVTGPRQPLYVVGPRGGTTRLLRRAELSRWAPPGSGHVVEPERAGSFGIRWFEGRRATPTIFIPEARSHVWSPQRREFAYLVRDRLLVFDTTSRRSRLIARTGCRGATATRPAWSPDGQWLAYFACPPGNPAPGVTNLLIAARDGTSRHVLVRAVVGGSAPSWRR